MQFVMRLKMRYACPQYEVAVKAGAVDIPFELPWRQNVDALTAVFNEMLALPFKAVTVVENESLDWVVTVTLDLGESEADLLATKAWNVAELKESEAENAD